MSLSAYLAKNYLNADTNASTSSDPSNRPKKRRKKDKSTSEPTGLIIADDDFLLSNTGSNLLNQDDEDGPLLDTSTRSAEFRKAKKNNWKTVGALPPKDSEQAEADRILAVAAAESKAARSEAAAEDAPTIANGEESGGSRRMESGTRAGLQTAADTETMVLEAERRKAAELKSSKKSKKDKASAEEETVYRDATGRRIDVSMKRAEARATELERLRKEQAQKLDAMGEVQKQQREQRKQDLDEAKFLSVARYEDDEGLNEELKGQVRWDDPMAEYMAKKEMDEGGGSKVRPGRGNDSGRAVGPRKKVYQGAAPPNRYGIKPGWRWDGVDRGNGFEKEWFQARGRKSRNKNLEYQWQMDE